jgi:hypothetical protein
LQFGPAKAEFEMQSLVRRILADRFEIAFGGGGEVTAGEHFVAEENVQMRVGRSFDAQGFLQSGVRMIRGLGRRERGCGRNGKVRTYREWNVRTRMLPLERSENNTPRSRQEQERCL